MVYAKQNFVDGKVLTASQLNHIESGIAELETSISNSADHINQIEDNIADLESRVSQVAVIGEVTLLASRWTSSGNLHSQVVTLSGVTENSQVDLTPSVEQLVVFYEKDLAFVTENEDGVVTVYAIGQKPTNDYTIQVTITEVGA
jgi:hypothetical protein